MSNRRGVVEGFGKRSSLRTRRSNADIGQVMGRPDSRRARCAEAIPGGASRRLPAGLGRLACAGLAVGLTLALWAAPAAARGPIFTYTDGNGVVHFTNVPRGDTRFKPIPGAATSVPRKYYRAPRSTRYDPLIDTTARLHGVPPALIKAVIAAESAFNSQAVSHKGAQGLMQLMPATAASLGVDNAFEPAQNVFGGTAYLREMIHRFGDLSRALAAYNAGPRAVDRYGGIPPYPETQAYVERVLTYYRRYHGDFGR